MRKLKYKSKGFASVVALLLITFAFFVFARVSQVSHLYFLQTNTQFAQQQAKLLVYSGLNLALLQLLQAEDGNVRLPAVDKEAEKKSEQKAGKEAKKLQGSAVSVDKRLSSFFSVLLPRLNTWQSWNLDWQKDGIAAEVATSITCEDGKINLNKAINFKEQKFIEPYQKFLTKFKLKNLQDAQTFPQLLKKHLEKTEGKKTWFSDVLELTPQQKTYPFYRPSVAKPDELEQVELYDLFTTHTDEAKINPLLFSSAVRKLLRLAPALEQSKKQTTLRKICDKINVGVAKNWQSLLPHLAELYKPKKQEVEEEKKNSAKAADRVDLKQLQAVLSTELEPQTLSVLCKAKFKSVVQVAVFVVRRQRLVDKDFSAAPGKQKPENKPEADKKKAQLRFLVPQGFELLRVFWL